MHTIERVFLGKKKKKKRDVFQFLCGSASCFTTAVFSAFSVCFLKILFSYSKVAYSSIYSTPGAEAVD